MGFRMVRKLLVCLRFGSIIVYRARAAVRNSAGSVPTRLPAVLAATEDDYKQLAPHKQPRRCGG